jgi:hypothetical protein
VSAAHFPGLEGPAGGPARPSPAGDRAGSSPGTTSFPGSASARPWDRGGLDTALDTALVPPDAGERHGPPLLLLVGAGTVPLATVALVFLDGWGWHVLGWAVATFGTAGLLIAATLQDTRRRASAWYLGNEALVRLLRLGAVVLALLAAAAHSWQIADWLSRLEVFAS